MPLRVICGQCRTECTVPDTFAGKEMACPRCRTVVHIPGPPGTDSQPAATPVSTPASTPVLDVLDEELGHREPAAGVGGADPWAGGRGGRRHYGTFRLSDQMGVGLAAAGTFAFFVLMVVIFPKFGVVLGWLIAAGAAVGAFSTICWMLYLVCFLPPSRRRTGPPGFGLMASLAAGAIAAGGIFCASYLIDKRENPWKYVAPEVAADSTPRPQSAAQQPAGAKPEAASSSKSGGPAKAKGGLPSPGAPGQAPGAAKRDEDIPPAKDLITFEGPKLRNQPGAQNTPPGVAQPGSGGVQPAPLADPGANPLETAYEEASRKYAADALADLIAGNDDALQKKLQWFALENRPVFGFRWGLGVQTGGQPGSRDAALPKETEKQAGALSMALVGGLERRIAMGVFGDWPEPADPRFRQVALLRNGRPEELVAAAKRRGLDILVAVDPMPNAQGPAPGPASAPNTGGGIRVYLIAIGDDRVLGTFPQQGGMPMGTVGAASAGGLADQVLKFIDDQCTLKPIPWPIIDQARQRIPKLLAMQPKTETALGILLEARYFQVRNLLPVDQAIRLYEAILGAGRGEALATGDAAKRREVVQAWLNGG